MGMTMGICLQKVGKPILALLWLSGTLHLIYNVHKSTSSEEKGPEIRIQNMPLEKASNISHFSSTNGSPLLKVPYPIFVASLPKSATTSVARMFYCGHVATAHTFANTPNGNQVRIGECYKSNVAEGKPPFDGCGKYDVWSDNGFIRGQRCYYPSIHGLSAFYEHYPNATVLLVRRKKESWRQSMRNWKKGALIRKWRVCSSEFPPKDPTDEDLERFYEEHSDRIRKFVSERPSLRYIEVQIEDDDAPKQLTSVIGINETCLKHHNSHEKRLRLNPKFRRDWEKKNFK